jgi:uncharacterized protein (UPF0179 family)
MPDITMIAQTQAKPGFVFFYQGGAGPLEAGHRYQVQAVRAVKHPCALQETDAKVVEVAPVPRPLLVEAGAAFEGSTVEQGRFSCSRLDCPNWDACAGPSLADKSKFRIVKVDPTKAVCLIGRNLKRVEAV